MKYRAEIDGLRAIAVLPVLLFHAGFEYFRGGYIGVDVFFVLSGFLITSHIYQELSEKKFSLVDFYERRARRILPALICVKLACIPFAWAWMMPDQMRDFTQSLVASALFSSNFLFFLENGYFSAASEEKPLLHTWSLSVEEQFYLVFPVFFMVIWFCARRRLALFVTAVAIASFVLSYWSQLSSPAANFYLTPMRAWELMAGSMVAIYLRHNQVRPNGYFATLGLLLILCSYFVYDESTPFPGVYALQPVVGVVLIILFAGGDNLVTRLLRNKYFVGLGLISYSTYLIHQPLFAFARIKFLGNPAMLVMVCLLLLTFLLAYLNWRYVEQPLRFNKRVDWKRLVLFYPVFVLLLGGLMWITTDSNRFMSLRYWDKPAMDAIYSAQDRRMAETVRRTASSNCQALGLEVLDEEVCYANSSSPKLLIVGDSKAMALASGVFAGYFEIPTLLIAGHSCPIYPGLAYEATYERNWDNNCTQISDKALRTSLQLESIEAVIIANHAVDVGHAGSRYQVDGGSISHLDAMNTGYGTLFETYDQAGLDVVFLTDVPRLKLDPYICVYRDDVPHTSCNLTQAEFDEMREEYNRSILRLLSNFPRVSLLKSEELLCASEYCESFLDDKILYFDTKHITPYGAYLLIREMFSRGYLKESVLTE